MCQRTEVRDVERLGSGGAGEALAGSQSGVRAQGASGDELSHHWQTALGLGPRSEGHHASNMQPHGRSCDRGTFDDSHHAAQVSRTRRLAPSSYVPARSTGKSTAFTRPSSRLRCVEYLLRGNATQPERLRTATLLPPDPGLSNAARPSQGSLRLTSARPWCESR